MLNAPEVSRREYVVAKFQLLPQSENIFLIYKDGWHPAEVAADNPTSEWQWTQKPATFSFRNPKKDATFYLEYDARTDLFTPPQQVTVRLGDQPCWRPSRPTRRSKKLVTFSDHGGAVRRRRDGRRSSSRSTGPSSPAAAIRASSGIRVFHTFIEPK